MPRRGRPRDPLGAATEVQIWLAVETHLPGQKGVSKRRFQEVADMVQEAGVRMSARTVRRLWCEVQRTLEEHRKWLQDEGCDPATTGIPLVSRHPKPPLPEARRL
jgi:hypothetical protein